STFVGEMRRALNGPDEKSGLRAKQGAGLRILTETITSPSLAAQLKGILADLPQAKWHQYEPANRDNARAGAIMAFGQPVNTIYDFSRANRLLSLGSDFLACLPGSLRYARDFAAKRRPWEVPKSIIHVTSDMLAGETSRLYVIETTPTTTGASADHRLSVRPSEMVSIAQAIAAQVGAKLGDTALLMTAERTKWLDAVARDLVAHKGASIVIVGDEQPPLIHSLGHAMNAALGNVGYTVSYTDPIEANSVDQTQSLRELVNDMDAGQVELLVIIGGNPIYNTPLDLKLDQTRLSKVKLRVHLSQSKDETSELCHWHVPEAYYLESWADTRSYDGTVTIVQPLIAPLFEGKTAHEVLAVFRSEEHTSELQSPC